MLAQNFKTPAELEIEDAEFNSLVQVLGMLERREIKPHQFDMGSWDSDCGTAHCIGGWAEAVMKRPFSADTYPWTDTPLSRLFYPDSGIGDGYSATTEQAATALRNYLTHGDPRWSEALETA